jgi:hypothetical protein
MSRMLKLKNVIFTGEWVEEKNLQVREWRRLAVRLHLEPEESRNCSFFQKTLSPVSGQHSNKLKRQLRGMGSAAPA